MNYCHIERKQAKDQPQTLQRMLALTHIRGYGDKPANKAMSTNHSSQVNGRAGEPPHAPITAG